MTNPNNNLNRFNYIFESSQNGLKLKPTKSVEAYLSDRRMQLGIAFAFACLFVACFIGGVMYGEVKESNKLLSSVNKNILTLSIVVEQNSERYRIQRAADLHLQKMHFLHLQRTDSLLLTRIIRTH